MRTSLVNLVSSPVYLPSCCCPPLTKNMNRTKNSLTIGKQVTVKSNASTLAEVSASVSMKQPCSPDDEIYLKPLRLGCPYCKRTKVHRSLFRLNYHISTVHKFDTTDQDGLIGQLEFLISRGVILS